MQRSLFYQVISFFILFIFGCDRNPSQAVFKHFEWQESTPQSQNMDTFLLDSAFIGAEQSGFVDALLVFRNGYLLAEQYYNYYDRYMEHNVMSVSKSFLSALVGMALNEGILDSLDEKVLNYFPEYIYDGIDQRKHDITIRHLLTMRMGIANESQNYFALYYSDNWIAATIGLPLLYAPGERMLYNTFQTHLLSGILTKAAGKSTYDLMTQLLTDPMGIDLGSWEQDPQGYYFGGNSMHFVPRDMAVLGYMYMNDGRINNQQIVPKEWVQYSLSPSTNNGPNEWGSWKNYNYASLWWLGQMNEYNMFMAYGYGGQFIMCFPDLDLIVVATSNNIVDVDTSNEQEWAVFDLVTKYILPSVIR